MTSKPKTIYRTAGRENPYAQIVRTMLQDETLSLDAAGALVFILSLPDTWEFDLSWLCRRRRVGRDKALRIVGELIKRGYCNRRRDRDEKGRLGPVIYEFSDDPAAFHPQTEKPFVEAQDVVSPHPEYPTLAEPTLAEPTLVNPHQRYRETDQSSEREKTKERDARGRGSDGIDASDRLPFSPSVVGKLLALGVDVHALVDQYQARTKGRHIKDPSAYLLKMGEEEAAKRLGVTADQIKGTLSRNRDERAAAAAQATGAFSVPTKKAVDNARRWKRPFVDQILADLARRRFPTQAACDLAFQSELTRSRPPMMGWSSPDLFSIVPANQQKEDAA